MMRLHLFLCKMSHWTSSKTFADGALCLTAASMAHKVAQVTPSLRCKKRGLQQKMCHNALKTERGKKYEISFAREARVFTFQTYTFFKGTCISSKPYTVGV